jgi:hypothetical protein
MTSENGNAMVSPASCNRENRVCEFFKFAPMAPPSAEREPNAQRLTFNA